jgi:SLOG family YspA-like protein
MRVIVTASRTWSDPHPIRRDLADLCGRACWEFVVIHGAAKGGDTIASQWVADQRRGGNTSVSEEPHRANWNLYGRAAGIIRNTDMVRSGADLCLAYLCPCTIPRCKRPQPHDTHGAVNCAELAHAAGIEVRPLRWEERR